ncbi:MAG: hypothetical protein QOJ32_1124 [Frankiaceae bacterium]|jgi:hypothetical protein|nr:hypothetical protein [Frankiaceae bacterium]
MTDPGFVVAGYTITALVITAYAASLRARMRRADPTRSLRNRDG